MRGERMAAAVRKEDKGERGRGSMAGENKGADAGMEWSFAVRWFKLGHDFDRANGSTGAASEGGFAGAGAVDH